MKRFNERKEEYINAFLRLQEALNLEAEIIRQKIFKPTRSTLGKYVKEYHEKFNFEAKIYTLNNNLIIIVLNFVHIY